MDTEDKIILACLVVLTGCMVAFVVTLIAVLLIPGV
jgi:hypothetical protein